MFSMEALTREFGVFFCILFGTRKPLTASRSVLPYYLGFLDYFVLFHSKQPAAVSMVKDSSSPEPALVFYKSGRVLECLFP